MNITHISVSRKKCFDECAQKYKYRYHLEIPSPVEERVYFTYGKIIHKVAEEYVKNQGKITIGNLSRDVLRGKIEIEDGKKAPDLPDEYKKKLAKHLRIIQEFSDKVGYDGHLEYSFRYDLEPSKNKFVVGFIDRLIIRKDKAWIIDYKTTKKGPWRANKETIKRDLQLRCYAMIVKRDFGIKAENIRTAFLHLEGNETLDYTYSDASLGLIEKELLDAYDIIKMTNADDVRGNVGWHCKNCDYCSLCPFYKSSQNKKSQQSWDGDLSSFNPEGKDLWS